MVVHYYSTIRLVVVSCHLFSTNSAQLLRKTLSFPSLITLILGLINYIAQQDLQILCKNYVKYFQL